MYNVLYFDDEVGRKNTAADRYEEILETTKQLVVELRYPPADLSDLPIDIPDAVLIDFDLKAVHIIEGAEQKPELVAYYGSTLASEMRMRNPHLPIILITRPGVVITENWMQQLLERSIDFDAILSKDSLDTNTEIQIQQIVSIIDGHQHLSEFEGTPWQSVITLMGANDDEANDLREASPPIEGKGWSVPTVSRWIREVILKYPGIVYDALHASVRLGVSLDSFRNQLAEQYFREAEYTGIFASPQKYWWRDRILSIAQNLIQKHNVRGPILTAFVEAFRLETGIALEPSICISDGTPVADWVCYILKEPVKSENSIPYYPDERPLVMDQARVSRKAILESDSFDENLVDAESQELVR